MRYGSAHIAGDAIVYRRRCLLSLFIAGSICALTWQLSAAAEVTEPKFTQEDRDFWLWQPVSRPTLPDSESGQPHPVDVLLSQNRHGDNERSHEVDRRILIRRATFDLHGLPPTPQEVTDFVSDQSPQAFERVIDRLLASPRYGEHWAQYWLDLVRYAESDGFKSDDIRPNAWRYRDYVIRSLNDDKPYDRFVSEQLAGDELAPDDMDARVATGFLRLGPYEENARDVLDQRNNVLNDVTDVTGQVFLGLTFACARCHDHKYDPILQADYFRLQAFFAAMSLEAEQPLANADARAVYDTQLQRWEESTAATRQKIDELEAPYRAKLRAEKRSVFPDYVQTVLDMPSASRSPLERQMVELAERQLVLDQEEVIKKLTKEERAQREELARAMTDGEVRRPAELERGLTANDIGSTAPETKIPNDNKTIEPGFLSILDPAPATIEAPRANSTGRRLALARWITNPENPLTARVLVNRVFQQHFGRGIVASSEDFGRQGSRPSNPALLDYLATEFLTGGQRLKSLHRLLMTSAAYRQASPAVAEPSARSGGSELPWWQATKRRLTAEQLRDAMLLVSGELNPTMGGPSIRGELPAGLSVAYAWEPDPDPQQRNRRSIYMFARRNLQDPLIDAFDAPDSHESCTRRMETTTAPQALLLLNGQWSLDRARAFAGRILREAGPAREQGIKIAYSIAFQREPTNSERTAAEDFLVEQRDLIAARLAEPAARPAEIALPTDYSVDVADTAWLAAWVDYCHVLLNSNEFLYLD